MARQAHVDLQSLVDSHDRPFIVIDDEYRIVAVNAAYEKRYGYTRPAVLGRRCFEISHGNQAPCHEHGEDCPYQHVFSEHERCACTHLHCDEHGSLHRVRVTGVPLRGEDGRYYLGELIDDVPEQDAREPAVEMVGSSAVFRETLSRLRRAAGTTLPVLLLGETGTGKELAARLIHQHSDRAKGPFVVLDCTVLSDSLFEAEMFGHTRGAFTGSVGEKAGMFELADGGTLFLDEIGEMPLPLQAKLLRVLETGEFRRVGGRQLLHSDVRVVCATNRDLDQSVARHEFRRDLYHRIACLTIEMPPLRERMEDIPELARALLRRADGTGQGGFRISGAACAELSRHDYPGNVRELRNLLLLASAQAVGGEITAAEVVAAMQQVAHCRRHTASDAEPRRKPTRPAPHAGHNHLQELEAQHIRRLMEQCEGNRKRMAAALGVSERTLYRKLKQYDIH